MMDWFNTNFYRDYAYGVVYPQIFPHHKRPSEEIQNGTIAWNKELTKKWLTLLNDHWLGGGKTYLVGDELTIADYFGAALLTCGHVIRTDFKSYPNIVRWLETMQKMPKWSQVNKAMDGFREALKEQKFDTV
jgi:glutathione S-transferase